jgi:hypothetical protein
MNRMVPPPSGFHPAPESDPAMPAPLNDAPLSRGSFAPTAPPFRDEPPLPECCLLRVKLRPRRSRRPRRLPPVAISPAFPPGALSGFLPPGLARPEIGTPLDVRLPSGDWPPLAFVCGASLQGFHPSDRLGSRVGISPSRAFPALLGFCPPWGSPLCRPRIVASPAPPSPSRGSSATGRRSSSPAFRDSPRFRVGSLCS